MARDAFDELVAENARLRRVVVDHPAAQTLRWLAPFVREDLDAGRWPEPLPPIIRRELGAALSWLERFEAAEPAGG